MMLELSPRAREHLAWERRWGAEGILGLGMSVEGLDEVLPALERGDRTREEILEDAAKHGFGAVTLALEFLTRLGAAGLLGRTLDWEGVPTAVWEPFSSRALFFDDPLMPARPRLSRFAWVRFEAGACLVETSRHPARVQVLTEQGAAVVMALSAPREAPSLEHARPVLVALANAGILVDGDDEDRDPVLRQWSFHDLLFHSRSRMGRHGGLHGATFRFVGDLDPLPASAPSRGPTLPLPKPDLRRMAETDPPLVEVVERRRSTRVFSEEPVPLLRLAHFLYRVARVRAIRDYEVPSATAEPRARLEIEDRPYPAGGALHELSFYLTVAACDGLEPGVYQYLGVDHALLRVAPLGPETRGLLADACRSAGVASPPPILLTVASRFQRLAWKYEALAYAATLKHVGVFMAMAYLAGDALGLGVCALGSGDADRFARATGRDYYVEGSVGELMLGLPTEKR